LDKEGFYRGEYLGAPLVDTICFRCTKNLAVFLRAQGMVEGRDASAVIRRLLTKAAMEEGFDPNGCP